MLKEGGDGLGEDMVQAGDGTVGVTGVVAEKEDVGEEEDYS